MSISEVYASNVMPQDIANFLGCRITDTEAIEECRGDFLDFLLDKEEEGVLYYSQVTAWSQYTEWQILYSTPEEFEHLDMDFEEIKDMSWSEELEMLLERLIKPGNYNEFGGQQ